MKTTFSWRNYFAPTPANLQYISIAIKSIVGGVASTTLIMEANKWITFTVFVVGLILDEVSKFFAHVNEEENKRVITVEVPANTEVEVKDEVKSPNDGV